MSSYVDSALTKGEHVIYKGKVSLWSLAHLIIIGVILSFFIIGIIFLALAAIRYFTTELAITNKRVIAKFGLISRTTVELNIHKIESIQVNQGIFGRIFNYGSIVVAGAGNPQAPVIGISNPLEFRRQFIQAQEKNNHPQSTAVSQASF